ncbi:MAG TPA: tetratricopeptide repeat protein [Thermodesulfobacteriota bacterium]|nr:tetratricopeptide repeat protein [Thermodesulfobacteriota bacterium]
MKKESAFLFIAIAFVIGVVVGVVATVLYEEQTPPLPSSIKPPLSNNAPAVNPDAQKQISILQSILKEDPKNQKALIELANLYFDAEQFDPAIQAYSKVLEIDPRNADARTDMGIMYRRKGDFDRAIAEFKKAAEFDPAHVNSRYNLGVVLLHDKGDVKGAIKAWEDFLKVEPAGPRAENIRKQMEKLRGMVK